MSGQPRVFVARVIPEEGLAAIRDACGVPLSRVPVRPQDIVDTDGRMPAAPA